MAMWRHLLERSIYGLLTLVLISALIFVATNVLPGDAARAILGRSATPEAVAALQAQLGLDRPLVAQYAGWVADILHGNLGNSVVTKGPVWDLVGPRLTNSLVLLASTHLTVVLVRASRAVRTAPVTVEEPTPTETSAPAPVTAVGQEPVGRRELAARLRVEGWSNKAIAREFGVAPSTVGRWFAKPEAEVLGAPDWQETPKELTA